MSEQLSAQQIVKDWKDGIWHAQKPESISARTECYDILAEALKSYGYGLNVFTESFKRTIVESTVGSDKKNNYKDRVRAAGIYLDKMIVRHFGTKTKFGQKPDSSVIEEKSTDIKPAEQGTKVSDENPSKSKFKEAAVDPAALEFVQNNFKFDSFSDEDFE